ncbi:MAG: 2-dehydro-3-deoxy-6-phosphogalactonate aldolase [Saccharospirillum sp.]
MEALQKLPYMVILRGVEPCQVESVVGVLLDAQFTLIEIPLNSPDALRSIRLLRSRFGDRIELGAGTVLTSEDVEAVHDAGASFVVSPNFNPAVVMRTKAMGMMSVPGCLSPSECFAALDAGADMLKIFPASAVGSIHIKALQSVLPSGALILPTGGITAENLSSYLRLGVAGVGLGEALYKVGRSLYTIKSRAFAFRKALGKLHD